MLTHFRFATGIFIETDRNYSKVAANNHIIFLLGFILYFVLCPFVLRREEDNPQILEVQAQPRYLHPSRGHSYSQYINAIHSWTCVKN